AASLAPLCGLNCASGTRCSPPSRSSAAGAGAVAPGAPESFLVLCSCAVFGVYLHVIERQIASPYGRVGLATVQHRTHHELGLLHRRRALLLPIGRVAAAVLGDQDVIYIEID